MLDEDRVLDDMEWVHLQARLRHGQPLPFLLVNSSLHTQSSHEEKILPPPSVD